MREYKFRGKRLDNGKWVYGDLMTKHIHHNGATIVYGGCIYCEVDPATIGQFTGLHDKNGKRIFEGDVLRYVKVAGHTSTGVVKYVTEFARWEYWHTTQKEGFPVLSDCDSMENIGTIHDNPELLEVTPNEN